MSLAEAPLPQSNLGQDDDIFAFYTADNPYVERVVHPDGSVGVQPKDGTNGMAAQYQADRDWQIREERMAEAQRRRSAAGGDAGQTVMAEVIQLSTRRSYPDFGRLVASCAGSGSI